MVTLASPTRRFYKLFYRWSSAVLGCSGTDQSLSLTLSNPAYRKWRTSREITTAACRHTGQRAYTSRSPADGTNDISTETSLPGQMRLLMRRIPHPIVILTATHPPPSPSLNAHNPPAFNPTDAQHFRGMTISSFNTVCLEPRPIVSFNMKLPSRTYDAVRANDGAFLIHFLNGGVESARIADGFTRGQEEVRRMLGLGSDADGESEDGSLVGSVIVDTDAEGRSSPVISGSSVARVLRCRLLADKEIRIEDHVVLCAEVLGLRGPEAELERGREAGLSLVYVDREFREVGKAIDWKRKRGI